MMDKIHAKLFESGGQLRAELLTPENQTVENVALKTFFPLGPELISVVFCDMPYDRALWYSSSAMFDVLAAIADATSGVAHPGERWYALRFSFSPYDVNQLLNKLSRQIAESNVGWVNPVVLTLPDGDYLLDLALSDEARGREIISKLFKRRNVHAWSLVVKWDGLNVGE